jgi:hypothetical protein
MLRNSLGMTAQGREVDITRGLWHQLLSAAAAVKAPGRELSGQELLDTAKAAGLHVSNVLNVDHLGDVCRMVVVHADKRLWTKSKWGHPSAHIRLVIP